MFKRKSILRAMLCILLTLCISCSNNSKQVDLELIPVQSGEKWGYVNQKGEYVITPQFVDADFFRDGLARVVSSEGNVGFIDRNGKYVIEPKFKDATVFSEGLAFAVSDGGYPICIDKHGDTNFQFKFGEDVSLFSDGLAMFETKGGKCGYVDKTGKIVINPQYEAVRPFSEGLAAVRQGFLWGFIDKNGNIVIKPQFLMVSNFKDSRALCRPNGQFGLFQHDNDVIDTKGRQVFGFDERFVDFEEGMVMIESDGEYGFISSDGKIKINPQYEYAFPFSEGLAAIEQNGKWGFIDKSGKFVINPEFDGVRSCIGNIAFVESAGKWGFIVMDKKEKSLVHPQFSEIKTGFGYNRIVESDWYDSQLFVSKLFEKAKDDTFDGFSINSTLQSIVDNTLYGDKVRVGGNTLEIWFNPRSGISGWIPVGGKHTAYCYGTQEMEYGDEISIEKVLFCFEHPFYDNVTTYSAAYGFGYKEGEEIGSCKQCKLSEKIAALVYIFRLSGKAKGKDVSIAHSLKTEIENRYGVKMESKDGQYSVFQDNGFSFSVVSAPYPFKTEDNFLVLYVGFNRKVLQDLVYMDKIKWKEWEATQKSGE